MLFSEEKFMDIIILFFIIFVIINIRFENNDNPLSSENTQRLRGVLAIVIILHHMSERINGGYFFPFLQHMGYLICAFFFFLSGYGLFLSYKKNGEKYLQKFCKKHILYLTIIFLLVSLIYTTYYIIIGNFRPSITIAANSWYVLIQLILYFIFWISFTIFKGKYSFFSIFLFQILLTIVLIIYERPSIWYISNFGFILGILTANYYNQIISFLNNNFIYNIILFFILFAVLSFIPFLYGYYILTRMFSSIVFCFIIVCMLCKIKFIGYTTKWLGSISLEIYLLHGLAYIVLNHFVKNDVLWTLLTISLTIPISCALNILDDRIKKILQ